MTAEEFIEAVSHREDWTILTTDGAQIPVSVVR